MQIFGIFTIAQLQDESQKLGGLTLVADTDDPWGYYLYTMSIPNAEYYLDSHYMHASNICINSSISCLKGGEGEGNVYRSPQWLVS